MARIKNILSFGKHHIKRYVQIYGHPGEYLCFNDGKLIVEVFGDKAYATPFKIVNGEFVPVFPINDD